VPSHYSYDFHLLPERVKRQLARSIADDGAHLREGPTSNTLFYVCCIAALLFFAQFGLFFIPFGNLEQDGIWNDTDLLVALGFYTFIVAGLALWLRRRFVLTKKFNFPPRQYLFPFTLIDARDTLIKVVDLAQATSINAVENSVEGSFSHTTFTFSFPDGSKCHWKVKNKTRARELGHKLAALQDQVRSAHERNDLVTILRLDPFCEIRKQGWALPDTGPVPETTRLRTLLANPMVANPVVGALVLAVLLSPVLWAARNVAADYGVRAEAKRLGTELAYSHYIRDGWFHVDEMRAARPRVALAEVKRSGSVSALRALLRRYPKDGLQAEANAEIHVLYQRSLAKFKSQATTADPALLVSMEKLLQVLEESGNPSVAIHFARPTSEQLAELDASLLEAEKEMGKRIIPAAVHFGNDSAAPREARIARGLQAAFGTIFPNDVLELAIMSKNASGVPRLEIHYQITQSGAVYTLNQDKERAFVGLVARFQSALEVGPAVEPWRFDMEVEPPDNFRIEYEMPSGAVDAGPENSKVYAVMAERAFDELASKIRAAFFHPDSAAFKR
jgi:hypothetical protein